MLRIERHHPGVALPDIPGTVHGIKTSKAPWTVQCDDCLTCWTSDTLIFIAKKAMFNQRADQPGLRLCETCWNKRGWFDEYEGWASRG